VGGPDILFYIRALYIIIYTIHELAYYYIIVVVCYIYIYTVYYMETVAAVDISRGILSPSPSPFRHGILCGGPVRARVGKVGLASAAGQPVPGTPVGGLTVRRYTLLDLLPRHGTFSSRAGSYVVHFVLFLSVYFLFVLFTRNDIIRFLI